MLLRDAYSAPLSLSAPSVKPKKSLSSGTRLGMRAVSWNMT